MVTRKQVGPDNGAALAPEKSRTKPPPMYKVLLLNDDFTVQISQAFADRLTREAAGTQESLIRRAYELALQREPDGEELASCQEFMGTHTLPELCRTILNLNEFSYVD